MAIDLRAAHEILTNNLGFADPQPWLDYAVRHGFQRVRAKPVPDCPDCGQRSDRRIGQYVYYSTLIHLLECKGCHLIWADAHIDSQVIKGHFEVAYKDNDYFVHSRRTIFQHLVGLIDRAAPKGGDVLDVGGAHGHLMSLLASRRPDLRTVVNDVSEAATRYARERYQLQTSCGDLGALRNLDTRYDVVLSDVLYYEPDLASFWFTLPRLVAPGGTVIFRVPNKLALIRAAQALTETFTTRARHRLQDHVRYYNPEHIYILTRGYLTSRLRRVGFREIRVLPSPLAAFTSRLGGPGATALFRAAAAINQFVSSRLVLTPSMVIVATNAGP
jgi:2-polyprenyl-3-methyl-5-hydroxy-6-metoxy-1,4-benzoquinol methylase